MYEIATDLNVGTVDDWQLRPDLLDQWDEARHLGVVYTNSLPLDLRATETDDLNGLTDESDITPTGCKWATLSRPAKTVLENPRVKVFLLFLGQAEARICHALENVVVVLRCPEYRW